MAKTKKGRGRKGRQPRRKAGQRSASLALQVNTVVASMIAIYTATQSVALTVVSVVVVTFLVTREHAAEAATPPADGPTDEGLGAGTDDEDSSGGQGQR